MRIHGYLYEDVLEPPDSEKLIFVWIHKARWALHGSPYYIGTRHSGGWRGSRTKPSTLQFEYKRRVRPFACKASDWRRC